jgi:hypothetical protein
MDCMLTAGTACLRTQLPVCAVLNPKQRSKLGVMLGSNATVTGFGFHLGCGAL